MLKAAKFASDQGYKVNITTNCSYAKSAAESAGVTKELKEAGVTTLGVSLDPWNQKYVPYKSVLFGVQDALKAGIGVIIQSVATTSSENQNMELAAKLVEDLKGVIRGGLMLEESNVISVNYSNVYLTFFPAACVGSARNLPRSEFTYRPANELQIFENGIAYCNAQDVAVNVNGEFTVPCCSFFSTKGGQYSMGNIEDSTVKDAVAKTNESVFDFLMTYRGVERLITFLSRHGMEEAGALLTHEYDTSYDLCSKLVSIGSANRLVKEQYEKYKETEIRIFFTEGKTAPKPNISANGKIFEVIDFEGPISLRDFWVAGMRYVLENRRETDADSEMGAKLMERAKKLPKWEG